MANTIQKESKIIYLQIGQNYENLGVQKQFDVSEWTAEFPDAHIYLLFKRPGEEAAAPVNTTLDEDGILTWTVSNWETGIIGIGFAEIRAIDSSTGLVKKSHVIPCSIEASVTDEDAAPDYPSWVDRMLRFGENVDSIYATLPHELEEGIASIQQEAQTQTEAIEQKGITTRASIPSDYTTLSDDVTSLKSAMGDITGNRELLGWSEDHKYIVTNIDTGIDINSPTTTTSHVHYMVVPCSEGDAFTITVVGGNASRAYTFIDANGNKLVGSIANITLTNEFIVAPGGTAYLVVNDTSLAGHVYIGDYIANSAFIRHYKLLNSSNDINDITEMGLYQYSVSSLPVNAPTTTGGIMVVYSINGTVRQSVFTSDTECHRYKTRTTSWGLWSSQSIPSAGNLNDYDLSGVFSFVSSATNTPSNDAGGILVVDNCGKIVSQMTLLSNGSCYIRYKGSANIWGTWVKLNNQDLIDEANRKTTVINHSIFNNEEWDVSLQDLEIASATITSDNKWARGTGYASYIIDVRKYSVAKINVVADESKNANIAFLTSKEIGSDNTTVTTFVEGETGRRIITHGTSANIDIPIGCTFVFIAKESSGTDVSPQSVTIDGSISKIPFELAKDELFDDGDCNVVLGGQIIVNATIASNNVWNRGGGYQSYVIDVSNYVNAIISVTANVSKNAIIAFLTVKDTGRDQTPVTTYAEGETGRRIIQAGTKQVFDIPDDCHYVLVFKESSGNDISPAAVSINGLISETKKLAENERANNEIGLELNPLRAINSDANGRDIPQSIAVRNAYRKAHQLLDVRWTALLPFPDADHPGTDSPAGAKEAVPYSSVKEYCKFVGHNVSLKTFMTAVHNPYSLFYTENTLKTTQHSDYGITYHGENCGPYYGDVCSSFDYYSLGSKIPWTTNQFLYLARIGKLYKIHDQSANGVRLMDVVWEPGHTTLITDITRDERGTPTSIFVSEYGPKTTEYAPYEFNERLDRLGGIIYCFTDLYKNLEYTRSEFVAVDGEEEPEEYDYNDDICTFAGDYASFNSGEDIYINYTAGTFDKMELYKDDVLLSTIDIDTTLHKVKVITSGYGKYKARLTNGVDYSDYTYFEVIDTSLTASYENGKLVINFSSANGEPIYAEIVTRAGFTRGFVDLDSDAIASGTISVDPKKLVNEQLPGVVLESTLYPRVLFRGDYGIVPNQFYGVSIG